MTFAILDKYIYSEPKSIEPSVEEGLVISLRYMPNPLTVTLEGVMMRVKIVLIGAILAFMSNVAYAGYFETGSSLMQGWRAHQKIMNSQAGEKDYVIAFFFLGYVTGVADARGEVLGVPHGITKDQICAIVGRYLENHPDEWNEIGSILVEKALRNAFHKRE